MLIGGPAETTPGSGQQAGRRADRTGEAVPDEEAGRIVRDEGAGTSLVDG